MEGRAARVSWSSLSNMPGNGEGVHLTSQPLPGPLWGQGCVLGALRAPSQRTGHVPGQQHSAWRHCSANLCPEDREMGQDWNCTCQESWGAFPVLQCLGLRDLVGESRAQHAPQLPARSSMSGGGRLLLGLGWTWGLQTHHWPSPLSQAGRNRPGGHPHCTEMGPTAQALSASRVRGSRLG